MTFMDLAWSFREWQTFERATGLMTIGVLVIVCMMVTWPLAMYTDSAIGRWCRRYADDYLSPGAALQVLCFIVLGAFVVWMGWTLMMGGMGLFLIQIVLLLAMCGALIWAIAQWNDGTWKVPQWADYDYQRKAHGFSDANAENNEARATRERNEKREKMRQEGKDPDTYSPYWD